MGIFDSLRPYLSRFVIAPLAVAAVALIGKKTGIQVDSESLRVAADLAIYGAVHKVADKMINPADTASKHLAVSGVEEHNNLKAE